MKTQAILTVLAVFVWIGGQANAAGFVIIGPIYPVPPITVPPEPPRPIPHPVPLEQPISVKTHQVSVAIKSGISVTTVEQVFHNPNPSQMEGQYIFPLEDDAAVHDFSIWMNGKEVKGELLEAGKARQIYEDIVRRMKDPGLLEYAGKRMVRCRIFPIPARGDFRVKLSYTQKLKADAELLEYRYPLRVNCQHTNPTQGQLTISVDLQHDSDILNVYSPSHKIDVVRKDAKHLKLSFETSNAEMDKDFTLFYNVSRKDVGLSLIPFNPEGEDGYFMAILTPRDTQDEDEITGKDVVFVLDKSGSMIEDGKIDQARKALNFCLASLHEKDRFGLVAFSTEAQAFKPDLLPATKPNVQSAIEYVKNDIQARGGTAIDEALRLGLKMNSDPERPFMVVFLTDGEPTIGERDPKAILKNVSGVSAANVRLFCFGVGYDVNVDLLQSLARDNRGANTFVVPKENIEIKVSSFYTRIASPVFTDVTVEFVGLDTHDVYPKQIGDIFRDQQIMLVGRYKGKGAHAVRLRGKVGKRDKEIVYETTFPESETSNAFVPRIWALKKVGYMLESIREHGESEELKQEIIHLAKRHGIMTPYTSWLVIEDYADRPRPMEEARRDGFLDTIRNAPVLRGQADSPGRSERFKAATGAAPAAAVPESEAREEAVRLSEYAQSLQSAGEDSLHFGDRDSLDEGAKRRGQFGAGVSADAEKAASEAVLGGGRQLSVANKELAKQEKLKADGTYDLKDSEGRDLARQVGGKTFYRKNDTWIDSEYTPGTPTTKVEYLSAEYFELLNKKPGLGKFFALGERIIVVFGGTAYEVKPGE